MTNVARAAPPPRAMPIALCTGEMMRDSEERSSGIAPPERPVVAARDEEESVSDAETRQSCCERGILAPQRILRAGVEPEEVSRPSECLGDMRQFRARRVR